MASRVSLPARPAPQDASGVWDGILHLLERNRLRPGDQLPSVRDLARRLRVKPTLVRDALLQAQVRGVVRIVPRVGAFLETSSPAARVLTTNPVHAAQSALQQVLKQESHNVLHLLDARRLIEVDLIGRTARQRRLEDLLPARRALERLLQLPQTAPRADHVGPDIDFHVELARLSGNAVLAQLQQTLLELLRPYLLEVPPSAEHRAVADRSHAAIYAAVVAGDAELARQEMRTHLSLAYDSLLRDLERPPLPSA